MKNIIELDGADQQLIEAVADRLEEMANFNRLHGRLKNLAHDVRFAPLTTHDRSDDILSDTTEIVRQLFQSTSVHMKFYAGLFELADDERLKSFLHASPSSTELHAGEKTIALLRKAADFAADTVILDFAYALTHGGLHPRGIEQVRTLRNGDTLNIPANDRPELFAAIYAYHKFMGVVLDTENTLRGVPLAYIERKHENITDNMMGALLRQSGKLSDRPRAIYHFAI